MKFVSHTRVSFVEMETDGQLAAWRAALATLAVVIERYRQQNPAAVEQPAQFAAPLGHIERK